MTRLHVCADCSTIIGTGMTRCYECRRQLCEIPGCDEPRYQRHRLCGSHFMRQYRYGDPLQDRRPSKPVCIVEGCGSPRSTRRLCAEHRAVQLRSGSSSGPRIGEVGYSGAHQRVTGRLGSAGAQRCVGCGGQASQWAYDHKDPVERQSSAGPYSVKPHHYSPMCVPCHKRMDLAYLSGRPPTYTPLTVGDRMAAIFERDP